MLKVKDIMRVQVAALSPDTGLAAAVNSIQTSGLLGLPVLDNAGKLVGFLSEQDCLQKLVTDGLVEAGLTYAGARAFSTPRRLTLALSDLTAESPTLREERRGPKVGAPDKAIEGFLRGAGVTRDLLEEREKKGINDVYLLRIEQLYPFPAKALLDELNRFKNAEVIWCQEEPKNMGAWAFIQPYVEWVFDQMGRTGQRVRYTGRPASASTATGLMRTHLAQLQAFLDEAFAQ